MERPKKERRRLVLAAVIVSTVTIVMASMAYADQDGGVEPGGALVTTDCREDVQTRVLTQETPSSTVGAAFAGFASLVVGVPAGASRCLMVEFNAETACSGDPAIADDFCYVRALDNGVEMLPLSGSFTSFQSEDTTAESNSHRWIRRVGAGNHTITLQRRTDGGATVFYLDDWMFSVTVLN